MLEAITLTGPGGQAEPQTTRQFRRAELSQPLGWGCVPNGTLYSALLLTRVPISIYSALLLTRAPWVPHIKAHKKRAAYCMDQRRLRLHCQAGEIKLTSHSTVHFATMLEKPCAESCRQGTGFQTGWESGKTESEIIQRSVKVSINPTPKHDPGSWTTSG